MVVPTNTSSLPFFVTWSCLHRFQCWGVSWGQGKDFGGEQRGRERLLPNSDQAGPAGSGYTCTHTHTHTHTHAHRRCTHVSFSWLLVWAVSSGTQQGTFHSSCGLKCQTQLLLLPDLWSPPSWARPFCYRVNARVQPQGGPQEAWATRPTLREVRRGNTNPRNPPRLPLYFLL